MENTTIRIQHCTNCGLTGHVFRNCMSPVTSYGIIAIRYMNDNNTKSLHSKTLSINNGSDSIEFLLIQRKDSLSFVEFIRGKYNVTDEEYICKLLRGMTQKEQHSILRSSFEELWLNVWGETTSQKTHKTDYEMSEKKYNQISTKLNELIQDNLSRWTEPEWGFPKGRRNPHETDINCAIREFMEETGLKRNEFTLIQNTFPISETFFGSNHVHYCHKYYIAICNKSVEATMRNDNPHMIREIGEIKWCSLDEAITKIRPDNVEKREILLKVGKIMRNFHPIFNYDLPRSIYRNNYKPYSYAL
jgi:8-oxo-dGTP pyrophosphatase MutT (NUDIX family)